MKSMLRHVFQMAGRLAWVTLMFASLPALGALVYDAQYPIYDEGKVAHPVSDIQQMLVEANAAGVPVIIYVHGRGDEPEKSFNPKMTGGNAMPRLAAEYGARVILIGWNSRARGEDRSQPLSHIVEAAATLRNALEQIITYEHQVPGGKRPSLLVHSMGSIALAKMVQQQGWPQEQQPIFSNILISEPDADSQNHSQWLSQISSHEPVYVTQNRNDSVLDKSRNSRDPPSNFALGLEPTPPYADGAIYVDLTDALKTKRVVLFKLGAHQVFSKSWMGGNTDTCL